MGRISFAQFQEENCGNTDKYTNVKKINEIIHNNSIKERKKHEVFTMSDMKRNSENFISTHIYDVGHGEFISLGNLEVEMIGMK